MPQTVPEKLIAAAKLFEERNRLYGDNYKNFGRAMTAMFPLGLQLTSESQHSRFAIFVQILAKLTRYAENFTRGGHEDSLDDLSVYAQMLNELDALEKEAKK